MKTLKPEIKKAIATGVANDITNEIIQELGRQQHFKTGDLINSVAYNVKPNGNIEISALDTLLYIEFGTPPHIIRPKNKKALRFMSGGQEVIVKQVNHPGTRPDPIVRNVFRNKFANILVKNVKRQVGVPT